MRFNIATGLLYDFHMWIMLYCPLRMAPPTWAKTGFLSCLRCGKECHLLTSRTPRGAGGFAIDACRTHRIDECSIRTAISAKYSLPVEVFMHFLSPSINPLLSMVL